MAVEYNRSDPEYFERALSQVFDVDASPVILGIEAAFEPRTLGELTVLVALTGNNKCAVSTDIDDFLHLIAADTAPDEIVQALPYDPETGDLMFVLPCQES